jgi:hypothetical protein
MKTIHFNWQTDLHGNPTLILGKIGVYKLIHNGDEDDPWYNGAFYDQNGNECDEWGAGGATIEEAKQAAEDEITCEMLGGIVHD